MLVTLSDACLEVLVKERFGMAPLTLFRRLLQLLSISAELM